MTGVLPAPSAPLSPYGPPSPHGPVSGSVAGFGPPDAVRHAPPVRARPHSSIAAIFVLVVVLAFMGCGALSAFGAAFWGMR